MAADVTPKDIWDALENAGASAVQAAGILGNAIAESSLNPEARALDTNGYYSNGLWQFNEDSYPGSGDLVTGNPAADLKAQVNFLFAHGGLAAAKGTTVDETASNFAANFERCQSCDPGGASNVARQANAAQVAGWATAGNWPTSTGSAADTATLTSAQTEERSKAQDQCAWSVGWGGIPDTSWLQRLFSFGQASGNVASGEICLLSKTQLRGFAGVGLLVAGTLIMSIGLNIVIVGGAVGVARFAGLLPGKKAAAAAPTAEPAEDAAAAPAAETKASVAAVA